MTVPLRDLFHYDGKREISTSIPKHNSSDEHSGHDPCQAAQQNSLSGGQIFNFTSTEELWGSVQH